MKSKNRIAYKLLRRKWYIPDWKRPNDRWKVLKKERMGDVVVLLTQQGGFFAVFTDRLKFGYYPGDKFYWGRKAGMSSYYEILEKEKERWAEAQKNKTCV